MKTLMVAEKASVARGISQLVQKQFNTTAKMSKGPSKFNPIYELKNCQIPQIGKTSLRITSTAGHVMTMQFLEDQ